LALKEEALARELAGEFMAEHGHDW